jgi:hypothetical protein
MDSMNRREVRVNFSQHFRCCLKTLACETDWTIFDCRFQILRSCTGFVYSPQVQSERTLNLRTVDGAVLRSYGVAEMVKRDAGTTAFTS